jgi:hypothetical protein
LTCRSLPFAAKRLFRLILPCAAIAVLLGAAVPLIGPAPRLELSKWLGNSWMVPVTL